MPLQADSVAGPVVALVRAVAPLRGRGSAGPATTPGSRSASVSDTLSLSLLPSQSPSPSGSAVTSASRALVRSGPTGDPVRATGFDPGTVALAGSNSGPAWLPLQAGLGGVFLSPLGLAALAVAIPIVALYLVRPDPERVVLPTLRFLSEEASEARENPYLSRLRRNLLLLVQLLAVLALALALASPYVTVAERETLQESVVVVDASASMNTEVGPGGATRFDRAVGAASEAVSGETTVVVAAGSGGGRVPLRAGSAADARDVLSNLRPTDAPADLAAAIETATAVAGTDARVVVHSDFADDSAWVEAVRAARARGVTVDLRQFADAAGDNVGIVDRSFSGQEVSVAVRNFGDQSATRTLSFGEDARRLELAPGDVATETFEVPAGGGVVRLTPGDALAVDDAVPVAAPADATIDVLLLTNDENRFLTTALSLIDPVDLTVDSPPTTVEREYDVVLYGDIDQDALLRGNVDAGRETLANGGGVAVLAQPTVPARVGEFLLVAPQSLKRNPSVVGVADSELTRGLSFLPPEEYLAGPLREGKNLVRLSDGSPLIATAERGEGRILYYGYIEEQSAFKFDYRYPVFWKRAVFYLSGREGLASLNYETGGRLTFPAERTVRTPDGTVTAATVQLDRAGRYESDGRTVAAALLAESESNVTAPPLTPEAGGGPVAAETTTDRVPRDLTHWVAGLALVAVLGEVGFLRYRGDL